ncbi:GNAT family N-acetyltransferase [Isosphaeraceae bacterium EP7]
MSPFIDRGPARWTIRDARPEDIDVLVVFNRALASETESKELDAQVLRRGLVAALADPERLRYWVAEEEGAVIGQIAVTREWSDWRCGWIWWLQSVYVAEPGRSRGVFRSLYRSVHEAAKSTSDVIGIRLYVEHQNGPARATYLALGLNPAGYDVFEDLWIVPANTLAD